MKDYRDATEREVVAHALLLVGNTLHELYPGSHAMRRGKGAFGQLVEKLHFGYAPNSDAVPDFPSARLELKATGVVPARTNGRKWRAKERLVLSIINYEDIVAEEEYTESAFFAKNARLLLVVYHWQPHVPQLDYRVLGVDVLLLDALDPRDRAIIEEDWVKIRDKVRAGLAHELSEGDTFYLAACRKGAGHGKDGRKQPNSTISAKQRAYSLKASFLTRVVERSLREASRARADANVRPLITDASMLAGKTLEDVVFERFRPYLGQSTARIAAAIAPELRSTAKSFYADLARRMLGIRTRKIEEFEKADVVMKIVRLQQNGRPKESMSFPAFRYLDLARSTWLESDLRETLSKRFLFVFFVPEDTGGYRFSHGAFWTMPPSVLDGEVRRVWLETVRRIRHGRAGDLPGSSFSSVAHVRPHGRNALDTDIAPDGHAYVKKCFWLNASYVGRIYQESASAESA